MHIEAVPRSRPKATYSSKYKGLSGNRLCVQPLAWVVARPSLPPTPCCVRDPWRGGRVTPKSASGESCGGALARTPRLFAVPRWPDVARLTRMLGGVCAEETYNNAAGVKTGCISIDNTVSGDLPDWMLLEGVNRTVCGEQRPQWGLTPHAGGGGRCRHTRSTGFRRSLWCVLTLDLSLILAVAPHPHVVARTGRRGRRRKRSSV